MKQRSQTLRKQTLERDNFTCQKCGLEDKSGKSLEVHHVIPLYQEGNNHLTNVITLCLDCHHFAPEKEPDFAEYMKEEMTGTFTTLMKVWKKVREEKLEL